jgi:hypothetical protein
MGGVAFLFWPAWELFGIIYGIKSLCAYDVVVLVVFGWHLVLLNRVQGFLTGTLRGVGGVPVLFITHSHGLASSLFVRCIYSGHF